LWVNPEKKGIVFFHGIRAHLQGCAAWSLCMHFKLLSFMSF
jgi:hypothetical protein